MAREAELKLIGFLLQATEPHYCSRVMRMKLAYNGHDIDSVAIKSDSGHWAVDVTNRMVEG